MKKLCCIVLILIAGQVFVAGARANTATGLTYRSSEKIDSRYRPRTVLLEMTTDKPADLQVPAFNSKDPYYGKWVSPLTKKGYLDIALDRSVLGMAHDLLYIDLNEDGVLSVQEQVKSKRSDHRHATLDMIKVPLTVDGNTFNYHFTMSVCDHGKLEPKITSAGWLEGNVMVGNATKKCRIVDYNCNGSFTDSGNDPENVDRLHIGESKSKIDTFVGKYVDVQGQSYQLDIAQSGRSVAFLPAVNINNSKIGVRKAVTHLEVFGENGHFVRTPENGICQLPAGKYRIYKWTIERKDDNNKVWKMQGVGADDKGDFEVAAGESLKLSSIGEPAIAIISVTGSKKSYKLNYSIVGAYGESTTITRIGKKTPAPKIRIKSKDGTYSRAFTLEYG